MQKLSAMENMYLARYQKLYGKGDSRFFFDKADQADRVLCNLRPYAPQYQEQFNKNFFDLTTFANYSGLLAIQESQLTSIMLSANPHPNTNAVLPLHRKIYSEVADSGIEFVSLNYQNAEETATYVMFVRLSSDDSRLEDIKKFVSKHHCSVRTASDYWFTQAPQ